MHKRFLVIPTFTVAFKTTITVKKAAALLIFHVNSVHLQQTMVKLLNNSFWVFLFCFVLSLYTRSSKNVDVRGEMMKLVTVGTASLK